MTKHQQISAKKWKIIRNDLEGKQASNGLVANAKKTSFLLLNTKQAVGGQVVCIGKETVQRDHSAALLGLTFQDNLSWKLQIHGKGGVLSALNSRLYIIRHLKSHLSMKSILRMVDGIFISKVWYGIQLLRKVRLNDQDPECGDLNAIQMVMNKLLRTLNGSTVVDRISTKCLLEKFGISSVNQINAQIKLLEMWKALNVKDYPLLIKQQEPHAGGVVTRASDLGRPIEIGKSTLTKNTCVSDAVRIWNLAPREVTDSTSLYMAKKAIKIYTRTLPI